MTDAAESFRTGWLRWCRLNREEDCENLAELAGWRAAAEANEGGGNRPRPEEWEEVWEHYGEE